MKKYKYFVLTIFCCASFFVSYCFGQNLDVGTTKRFLDSYKNSDTNGKFEMIDQVSEITDIKEAPFLRRLLDSDIDELKVAAITALGNIPSNTDIPLLRQHLLNQNSLIRIVSAQALLKKGDNSGVEALSDILMGSETFCSEIPLVLEALSLDNSEKSIGSLINFIKSGRCNSNYEGEALISIGKIGGKESIAFLVNYLNTISKNDINRTYAIQALCTSEVPAAIDHLKMIINDKDESEFNKSIIKTYLKEKKR